jgi:hypothetical protein
MITITEIPAQTPTATQTWTQLLPRTLRQQPMPYATLGKTGGLYLNKAAAALLGGNHRVNVFVDDGGRLALQIARENDLGAFMASIDKATGSGTLTLRALLKDARVRQGRYLARWENGVIVLTPTDKQ